jgi:hypothetical protein
VIISEKSLLLTFSKQGHVNHYKCLLWNNRRHKLRFTSPE